MLALNPKCLDGNIASLRTRGQSVLKYCLLFVNGYNYQRVHLKCEGFNESILE